MSRKIFPRTGGGRREGEGRRETVQALCNRISMKTEIKLPTLYSSKLIFADHELRFINMEQEMAYLICLGGRSNSFQPLKLTDK